MRIFTFYRSLASWRVRIALAMKGLAADLETVDLLAGAQFAPGYSARNPESAVPLLEIDGLELTQSTAILEYLEETRPSPPLLPDSPAARAHVRRLCQLAVADSHPLVVPRVRRYLADRWQREEQEIAAWCRHWLDRAAESMERLVATSDSEFACGPTPTMADICLVPHLHGARNFGSDTARFTALTRVEQSCLALDAFSATHPSKQPDFPG